MDHHDDGELSPVWPEHSVNVSPESQDDAGEYQALQDQPQSNNGNEPVLAGKRKAEEQVIELLDSDDEETEEERNHPQSTIPPAIMPTKQHALPPWMMEQQQPPEARPVADRIAERAHYISFPPNFVPTWQHLVPPRPIISSDSIKQQQGNVPVSFELTLLNVNEFTIEASYRYGQRSTDVQGLRKPIRQICAQHHVKAVRDEARWRIPLPAYQDVLIFLSHKYRVQGISPTQLQIAALERERQEKEYPDAETLQSYGVPKLIAETLAPFQRGGVDFVREKGGRALIADELRRMVLW